MAVAGELPSSNLAQLQQLLVCVFGLLFNTTPGQQQHWAQQQGVSSSSGFGSSTPVRNALGTPQRFTPGAASSVGAAAGAGANIRAQLLLRELRQVPLLPVLGRPGLLVAAQGGGTSFKPPVTAGGSSSRTAAMSDQTPIGSSAKVFLPLNQGSSSSNSISAEQQQQVHSSVHSTPPRSSKALSTPHRSRLQSGLRGLNTPGGIADGSTAAAAAAQLAEVALQHCGITQEQLAGISPTAAAAADTSITGDSVAASATAAAADCGQLLFVDPELLQLADEEALRYLVKGLKVRRACWCWVGRTTNRVTASVCDCHVGSAGLVGACVTVLC
jgi:hypothetical protein